MKPKLKDHAVLAFSEFLEENKIQHFIMYKKNKSSIGVSLKGKHIDKMILDCYTKREASRRGMSLR